MVTILDYGAGNLTSVCLAFERLGEHPILITEASEYNGGHLVFPGVGSAASGMEGVRARGFDGLLRETAAKGIPTLGICLGMQLLLSASEEDGDTPGLNLIPGKVVEFDRTRDPSAKIPHMGWNTLRHTEHPLFANIPQDSAFYFVHSFYVKPENPAQAIGTTDYCGVTFASAIASGALVATQFHPERSGAMGARLLANFLAWEGQPCF